MWPTARCPPQPIIPGSPGPVEAGGDISAAHDRFPRSDRLPHQPRVWMSKALADLDSSMGVKAVDYRWGFDDDSLMSVTRLIAPKPRKGLTAASINTHRREEPDPDAGGGRFIRSRGNVARQDL